jgi:uncharacterized membrane protein YvbJ
MFLWRLKFINRLPPISLIFDYDGTDRFNKKMHLQFKVFIGLVILFVLFLIQTFRAIFCKKVKRVRKFRPAVDDEPKKEK